MDAPMRLAALGAGAAAGFLAARRLTREATAWRLDGRVAIVTGGSRGLGLLLARQLLDAGCRVAICGRDADTLERAVALLGRPAMLIAEPCDVGDPEAVRAFVRRVEAELGPVELLVNNAATISVGSLPTMDAAHFARAMGDTFFGTLYPTLEVLPGMRARGEGRIANVCSIGSRVAMPHLLPYATAKYAQVGFSEGLRAELAAEGIVVTTIVPGFMRTGSFIAADYHDPSGAEYGWFAAGASLPLVAIDAEWAASRIVRAVRYGEGDVTLGWFARVGGTLKHAMPGLAADVLGLVNRWILPDAPPLDRPAAPHQPGTTAHHDAPQAVRAMTESTLERATSELNQPSP